MPNTLTLKKVSLLIIFLFSFISCRQSDNISIIPDNESTKPVNNFGFSLSDFNVLHDTIRSGDTFGSILDNQNLENKKVYDILEKVKDSFNVKTIRIGKPFTLLRTKDRYKKLQVFVYQPDRSTYYVIDFRDSVSVYKKSRPMRFKQRTIAGKLDGSLSDALSKQHVDAGLANKLTKVYAWSIDFFKLKKGDKFGITFTERYIDDTIYDGVDSFEIRVWRQFSFFGMATDEEIYSLKILDSTISLTFYRVYCSQEK